MRFAVRVLALALAIFLALACLLAVGVGICVAFGPLGFAAMVIFACCVVIALEVLS